MVSSRLVIFIYLYINIYMDAATLTDLPRVNNLARSEWN